MGYRKEKYKEGDRIFSVKKSVDGRKGFKMRNFEGDKRKGEGQAVISW